MEEYMKWRADNAIIVEAQKKKNKAKKAAKKILRNRDNTKAVARRGLVVPATAPRGSKRSMRGGKKLVRV